MFLRDNPHAPGVNIARPDHLQGLETYSQWAALKDQALLPFNENNGTFPPAHAYIVIYHADVQVRYLMLADAASLASELDTLMQAVNIPLLTLYPRPDAVVMPPVNFRHMIAFNIKPWGTCTTPSLIVPLGTVSTTALPAPGPATTPARTFDLTFTKCPRVNLQYFFRSPNGIAVDNVNGVVDLDSTPGNAQGVGVQLAHNGSFAGTAPVQFNQDGNTTVYTRIPAMGQNSSTGITHTIPMRAAVYRTSATPVIPGKVNASVLVYIQYP